MKLHLPKSLRTALLTCLAALAPVAVTLATGAISSGLVAFSISSAYAVDETGSLTSDTNWNASTDHSAHTTTVSSGAKLKVGNGSGGAGSVAANGTVNLGNLTLTGSSTMDLWAWTSTDKDVSTDGKVNIAGELTLNNSNIWVEDGSYYFSAPINVVGSSVITSKWAKGIVIGTINGDDDDASLTLRSQGTQNEGALFTLGVGTEGESSFNGTLILDNSAAAEAKTTTLALNDSVALKNAALQLNSFSNVIIMLDRVLVEALYGSGDVAHSYNNATGHASPVVQITGNATESQLFSGTVASNVTWQIGDGTKAASSRFSGATLNGALNIQDNSTAYLTGSNTFGSLTNNGTLYLNEGSSFSLSSVTATEGATINVGSVIGDGLVNNAFAYGNGWTATYDGNTGTATLSDTAVYWIDGGTDDNIAWSDGSNWSSGSVPASTDGVRLTADNAGKNIAVTSDVTVKELRLYGAYTMDISGSFTATDGYRFYDSASLTKVGAGTLKMTSTDALNAGIIVEAGILELSTRDNVSGKTITVNENVTVVFGGNTSSNVQVDVDGTGRVEVGFATGAHGHNVQLGSEFEGTLAISGWFRLDQCQIGSSASYEFSAGEFWIGGADSTVSNNINVVGESADAFRMRTGTKLTLNGVVTGNYSIGYNDGGSRNTNIILANVASSGTVDLDYGTLQLGNSESDGVLSQVAFEDMVINAAGGTNLILKIKTGNATSASSSNQLGAAFAVSGIVNMTIDDGSYHFAEEISLAEGAKLTINNGWNKNQFFSAIDAANATVVMAAAAQTEHPEWNTAQRLFLLNSDGDFNLQGSKIELKSAATNEYVHGLAVQKAGALSGAEVSFSSDASDKGSVLLFTNADYTSTAVTAATRVDGSVAGLSGTKGKVYAAGLTINTGADTSYTYGGELNITSLTKSGAGAQSLTQGLNLTGALNVQAGTLTLAGIVDVASITNTGIIDITSVETLTIGDLSATDGGSYAIGTLTGYESKDWNALLGVSQDYQVDYSGGNLLFSVDDGTSAIWVGGTGAVWDGTDSAGNATQSWVKEGADFVPSSLSTLILGNADTLTDAGYADAEVSREIIIDSDVAVKSLTVEDDYSLSVAEGGSYNFTATTLTVEEGGSLAKTGTGELSMSLANATAAGVSVEAGTLLINDSGMGSADLSSLTVADGATVSVSLSGGEANANASSRGSVTLGENFGGVLAVREGSLNVSGSTLRDATLLLNGGGILVTNEAGSDEAQWVLLDNDVVIGNAGAYVTTWGSSSVQRTTKLTGDLSGTGTLTKIDGGVLRLAGTMSGFTGSINVEGGFLYFENTDAADFSALTVNSGTYITVTKSVGVDSLTSAAQSFIVEGEGALLTVDEASFTSSIAFKSSAQGELGRVTTNGANIWMNAESGASINIDDLQVTGKLTLFLGNGGKSYMTIGETAPTGTTMDITGQELVVKVNKGSSLTDNRSLLIGENGSLNINGTEGGIYSVGSLAQTGGSISVGADSTLAVNGAATLTNISNSGTLDLSGATSLSLAGFNDAATTVDGTQTFTLGAVADSTEIAWNTLTGVSIADYRVKYNAGTVSYASATDTYIVWADTDDEETAWGEGSNWRWADDRSLAATPTSANKVQLTADAVNKSISMSGTASVAELNVQGAYDLDVAAGASATLTATTITIGEGGKLSKTGEGTLTMSMADAVAGKLHIENGVLKFSDGQYEKQSVQDLTALTSSADGILQMNGSSQGWASGSFEGVNVLLSDAFEGTLKVTSGQLNVRRGDGTMSDFGGASSIWLQDASITINGGTLSVAELVIGNTQTTILSEGDSTISSKITGSGTVYRHKTQNAVLNLSGVVDLDGKFVNQTGYLNVTGSTAAHFGTLEVRNGSNVTITPGLTRDSGITMKGGNFDLNGASDLGTMTMSGGTFNVNAATQIDSLSVTGGTFKINGVAVTVDSLQGNSALSLTGAADLTAVLADAALVTLTGAATADATLSVVTGGSATLSVAESLNSLTVTEGGALALTGALTLGDLYNTGSLDITNLSSLTLGGLALVDGAEYEVGTLTGTDSKDWNALLGLDGSLTAAYDGSKIVLSLSGMPVLWVGDAGSTWDEADDNGASTAWKQGENAFNPGEKSAVVLGNAASLGDLNDAVARTIILDADTVVGSVTVQDAYSFSVAEGETYSFDAGSIVLDGGSLSKTGAGTLSMSLEDAVTAQMNIAAGTLSISETLSNYESGARVDLTALNGSGTVSITAAGASGVTGEDTGQRTSVDLADSFTGTLAVVGGNLDMASTIGGAGSVLLDGATLVGSGSVVQELGWNIAVSDKGAYLRRFGYEGQDNRTEYATRLTGTLTGSAAAMLRVIDSGEWFLAGEMSGYQGGMSIEGNTNYVTFESSATLASLTAVNNSHILVDNNATLTASALAVSGTIYTGATKGATFNMGAVSIAADATLKLEGAGAHTLSTLAMGNNGTLELGANTSASITTATAGTTTGDSGHPGARAGVRELNGIDFTIKVGSGAELTDAGAWELSGGSDMTVSGGGVYHVAGIALGVNAATSNSLTIDNATTLHITGTNTTGSKFGDSFSLGSRDPNNTITVNGVLALECGISTYKKASSEGSSYKGYAEINVGSNGKIAFNNGLHAVASGRGAYTDADSVPAAVKEGFRHVAINIAGGGVLEISGTNNAGAEDVYVNLLRGAIVMGGGANDNKTAVFGGTVRLDQGFYAGAVEGTSLTLNVSPDEGWVHVLGSESTVYTAGGTVEFGQESIRLNALNVDAGGTARINHSAELYINEWGSINIAGTLIFDSADTITLNKAINNTGTVEVRNAADTQFVLSNELMQEIEGVSKTWTLVNNNNSGSITGWDALGLENFLLDGNTLQLGDWDAVSIADGKVMLYMLSRYWDATGAESVWNTGADANWRESVDSTETVTFESNSRVTFTDTDDTGVELDKRVTVAEAGVQAKSVTITGTGYVFSGGKVAVTDRLNIQESAEFDSTLVIGSTSTPLSVDVREDKTLTVGTLETSSSVSYGNTIYNNGAFLKTGKGTLRITDAIYGTITGATVRDGKLVLGVAGTDEIAEQSVALMVGANTISSAGGSLENVVLQTSGTVTDYTGATAQALNVIKSADGVNYAALTDVQLSVGAASSYATLQKVAFAGTSALSGYITFEETKQQRQMAVATDGTLTVSNLTFDLHGLSAGTKVLIENGAVADAAEGFKGTLEGWNSDNVTLLYSGIAVNSAAVDMDTTAGVVTLKDSHDGNLYWDGLVAGAAEGDAPVASSAWDKSSTNWSASAGTDGDSAFLALSNTYFRATPEGGSKVVNAALDMVMSNMFVTDGGYSFTGSRLATLGNMSITPVSGDVSFANELVVQGNVNLSAAQGGSVTLGGALQAGGTITATGEGTLSFNSTVQSGGDITLTGNGVVTLSGNVSTAGNFSIGTEGEAVTDKADASTLYTIAGALTAKDILINMDASTHTAAADEGDHLVVSGNVSAMGDSSTTDADGTITLLGSAAKKFTGYVTADTLRVNAAHGTLNNVITFTNVVDVNTLVIAEDTYVRIAHADSDMDTVLLGGTLYMDSLNKTYDNGYGVYSTSDSAELVFGTISTNIINLISGLTPAEADDDVADAGQYNSISVNANTRFLTVNALADLKDLTLYNGPMTVKAGEGAIHGNLVVRDAAGLVLTENANNIMAEGSGTIKVDHANMNLNSTTQTLRSGNDIYLAGGAITGNADGVGLNFADSSTINYGGSNTISANMTVAGGKTLTLKADYDASQSQSTVALSSDDTLLLSGALSGTGALNLTGDGVVTINKDNSAYKGTVTVGGGSSLELTHVDALSKATISLADDGTLVLNAGASVNVARLTIADGATLSLIGLAPTAAADLTAAGLINADTNGINWTKNNGSLTLTILLDQEVENMMTYNLFTDKQALATSGVTLKVFHNGQELDASQYNVGYDTAKKLVYIRTMLGNIWNGGSKLDGETYTADGIWGLANEDANWSGKNYTDSKAAIFVDAPTEESADNYVVVTLVDDVTPGDVYFEADSTFYQLNSAANDETAGLAVGTDIHKAGSADVNLSLANNGTMEKAIGNIDLQKGHIYLGKNLAVSGEVVIAKGAHLNASGGAALVTDNYTAKGDYSNLLMQSDRIAGTDDSLGEVNDGVISGAAELEYLNMAGAGTLSGVTIGKDVTVATGAAYTLAGAVTFNETLVNTGTVTLDAGMTAEIGQLGYSFTVDDEGASWYTYQLVEGGTINGMSDLLVGDVTIGGVSLGTGLADGVATYITNNNGSITLSIGNVTERDDQGNVTSVDGSIGVPQWDERWCDASKQPSLSRRYAGTTADTNVSFAEGITDDSDYYWYSSVVNAESANKVNGTGNEVVVTLSSASTGARAVGGSSAGSADLEMWVYDRSGFTTVVAGQFAEAATDAYKQNADTHVLVNSTYGKTETTDAVEKTWVVGGSWNVEQNANSYVTVQDGKILTLVGGSVNSNQTSTSYVYIDGGRVFEVVGASYADAGKSVAHTAAEGETLASHLVITGGNLGGLASDNGTKSVYGGGIRANITGDIKVTVDGTATITNLVGGNYQGSVKGNITMNLVRGTAENVNAAGAGDSSVTGNVSVYLSRDFDVSAGLFGGKQNNSGVTVSGTSTLYLTDAGEYVFAKWQGDAAGTHDGYNCELVEGSAVTIAGFDVVSLAQDTVLTVDTRYFDRDITGGTLVITGNGIVQMGGKGGTATRRDIRLENGATFKLLSSYTVENFAADYKEYSKLYVTDGTTFDISGYPRENSANDGGGSIAYHVYLNGDGVDGMGALYKGATEQNNSTNPSGKAALGYIELTGNASATAEHNIAMIGSSNATTYLDLNGYTYTKRGEGAYVLRNTQINGGTYYAHEGTVQPERNTTGADADLVLSDAATLKLNDNCNFTMRSLTGAGDTELGAFKLTLAPVSGGKYYAEFMKEANSYDNLMSGTGFAYGVYSGVITGSGSLYIGNKASLGDHTGVQYLSGTDSTFSGGTHVEAGRLYLLSSTQGSISKGSSSVTSGPIGTGALYWDSTTAEVYLGHGVTVYNSGGTNSAGSDLILGVEGAPNNDRLSNYPGVNGTVVKDGVTYHEVDTHNLQSISCDGVYADGTAYVAGTEIDRNKMLLVTEDNWNSESSTVKGFTDTGYNEATYSGVLSGAAALVKVGAGTLVIDQANAYTGGTRIEAGTLKLKGWAQIGAAADGTIDVEQKADSTLMLAYDGTYGDELTSISNNMVLKGTGDARWEGSDETGGDTAALISDVGSGVTFTLSGDISGDGNLLHSGEGTLVLSGDSSYSGGMHATRGVVEVQSSMGLGSGAVKIDNTAELHVTVEDGTTASRLATTIKAPGSSVKGDVVISGTESTERILNVATGGYDNSSTTLHDNGTLLVNGDGINAETDKLSGSGTVAVSDATGNGASATVGQMTDYTGDLHVEGNNASITVANGSYSGGSISVSGSGANVSTQGDVTITIVSGESLSLTSKGNAGTTDTSAAVRTKGAVNVTNGATLSVAAAETSYEYNLQNLQASASLNGVSDLVSGAEDQAYTAMGTSAEEVYKGFFNKSLAMNQKAAGSVDAEGGLTLSGGASYETSMANTSLMGGTLTLDTTTTSLLNFDTTLDAGAAAIDGSGRTTQLVLFSDVGGVNFVLDGEVAGAGSGIYYTRADRYIGGCGYVDEETWLVYDSGAGVVYLDGLIPEPTTATLSLLALAALAARRRRK